MSATYRNPWHRPGKPEYGPAQYTTDAKPVRIGKYIRYHRVQSSNFSANVFDYVIDGVCVVQLAGPSWYEEKIDAHVQQQARRAA